MQEEQKKSGWKIWVYLSPVYVILGMLLFRWSASINSSDVDLSKEEYNAFNASEGEITKRQQTSGYNPNLTDSGYNVRYRSGGAEAGKLQGDGPSRQAVEQAEKAAAARQAQAQKAAATVQRGRPLSQAEQESEDLKARKQTSVGVQKGYLSYAIGKAMNNPKAVGALMNNKYVVDGFMSRGTVKAATGSPQGLANYLKGGGPANFINNPVVKAALNNPDIVSAVASSGLISAMLSTPAATALMNDPQALGDLVNSNPQLMALAMQNPQTLNMLMSNPAVSGIVGKFDTSGIKK